jgi:cell division protein FtsQ
VDWGGSDMQTIQERLQKERSRKRLRRFRLFMVLFIMVLVAGGLWWLLRLPSLAIGDIVIHGSQKITKQEILAMTGCTEPVNLFRVSKNTIVRRLNSDVRVNKASASYGWPPVLNVYIEERQPTLYILNGYKGYVKVDDTGLIMDTGGAIKDSLVPLLTGISCGNVYIGDTLEEPDILEVLKFMKHLSREAKSQIAEVRLDQDRKVKVLLRYGFPVLLGPVDEVASKAELFMTVFNEFQNKRVKAEYIDLQYSKPYIKLIK